MITFSQLLFVRDVADRIDRDAIEANQIGFDNILFSVILNNTVCSSELVLLCNV